MNDKLKNKQQLIKHDPASNWISTLSQPNEDVSIWNFIGFFPYTANVKNVTILMAIVCRKRGNYHALE